MHAESVPSYVESFDESATALAFVSDKERAAGDERDAQPVCARQPLTKKHHTENRDKDGAQLINGRHARRISKLEGAKIADPGCAGCQAG
jgi:hypothetical protein